MSNHKPRPPQFSVGEVVMYRTYSGNFWLTTQPQLCIITDIQTYSSSHLAPGRQHNYKIRTYGKQPKETWIVDEDLLAHFLNT